MASKQRLGEILIKEKVVTEEILQQALRIQIGGNRRLGHILVAMKIISADKLAETLASQLDVPICDISSKYSQKVSGLVPRYLCRQYGVIPLAVEGNNVLQVAMADPCDVEAKNNLELYTDMVVEPLLARQSDIEREIPIRIPLGMKDFFSPQFSTNLTRAGVVVSLVLFLFLSAFTYQYIQQMTYGEKNIVDGTLTYKNHDLILEVDKKGELRFSGRSAFAKGYYSVTFSNREELKKFLERRRADFSEKQTDWLSWATSQSLR
jgi:hypothetical protein